MPPREAYSCNYAVFSFLTDQGRGPAIPVGLVIWSAERHWVKLRLLEARERLHGVGEDAAIVRLVEDQLRGWMDTATLPYQNTPLAPWTTAWWEHVRLLLVHRVRLSEPRAVSVRDPEEEIEPLYEAVVGGRRSAKAQRARIDGEIRRCLARLARRFQTRPHLPGFGGRDVPVLLAFRGSCGTVVVEGVNLTVPQAEQQVDATVSRFLRLRTNSESAYEILIGYIASPGGPNGEEVLLDWLRQQTRAHVFDLAKEREEFRAAADGFVSRAAGRQLLT